MELPVNSKPSFLNRNATPLALSCSSITTTNDYMHVGREMNQTALKALCAGVNVTEFVSGEPRTLTRSVRRGRIFPLY